MYYKFLKNDILNFLRKGLITSSAIKEITSNDKNGFLIESNIESVLDFLTFFDSEDDVFILNGFSGSGKSVLIDFIREFLDEDILFFKFNCFEATTLDDVLLNLYTDFIDYHNSRKIFLPKVDSTIFSDKVNAFIKASNSPIVLVIDSFEVLNSSEENKKDIINFINYLSNYDKIKLVISARNFDEELLSKDFKIANSIMKLVNNEEFKILFDSNKIFANFFRMEELYKNTRGHYLYASMSLNILSTLNGSVENLLEEFSKKDMSFYDFLVFKLLSFIPDKFLRGLWLLALIRQGLSEKFLIDNHLFSKEDIVYLEDRMILTRESGLLYVKDYIKENIVESLDLVAKVKIHKYLSEVYDSQLPKKPSERDLLISRATMRREIDYHKKIVEDSNLAKASRNTAADNVDFSYLSYSKTVGHEWVPPAKTEYEIKNMPEVHLKPQHKSKILELSKEELALLNASKDEDIEKYLGDGGILLESESRTFKEESDAQVAATSKEETMEELLKDAQMYEKEFDFESAVFYYKKALSHKTDLLFDIKKPLILTKLAICYKKLHDTDVAIKYFEDVYEIYQEKEPVKANYILLSIAQIYNETYKYSLAKNIYERILSSTVKKPPSLLIRTFLDMADIEDNNANAEKALEYCEKALFELNKTDDVKLSGEVYFKYALFMDDMGKIEDAVKFYQKCIGVSEDVSLNRFVSSSYSNLASIYSEQNNPQTAIRYYELALEADKKLNNFEGLYFGYSKLAHINQAKNPSLALEYLVKAMGAARRLDDSFYSASAYLDLGDFYYNRKIDDKALKSYLSAKKLVAKQSNEENIQKVNTRINDLKVRLGNAKFTQLINEFKRK